MSAVWEKYPGNGGSELLALLALADWSDDHGRCFPSVDSIAKKTRLSRSQAQRVVHDLIDRGYLVVTNNATGGAPGTTRRYRIVLGKLTGRTGATGSAHATGRTHAQEGSHPCGETGSAHATQTVIEPPLTVIARVQDKPERLPPCPHQKIVDSYHAALPELPKAMLLTNKRKTSIAKIWTFALTSKKQDGSPRATTAVEALQWISDYFERAHTNDFLMGRSQRSAGHENWECDLDFLLTEKGMKQVIEKTRNKT